jgi:pteridine reductase
MHKHPRPVALVTGAARRIGRAIAETLHAAGYDVVLHFRGAPDDAGGLAAELENARAGSTLLADAELADAAQLERLVLRAVQRFGRLDALVNNASSFQPTPLGSIAEADWDALFASNAKGPLFLVQAAAPHLRAARGAVVNLLDVYAERPLARHTVYSMAKAALAMATLSLARELAPDVRVNGVAPGAILWPDAGKTEQERRELVANSLLKRTGTPEEVAAAVLFLVRDATYCTGDVVHVDGGRRLLI